MSAWAEYFKGRRVTVMGIDPEGRGVQDALFAAQHGADVIATDVKGDEALRASLNVLRYQPSIKYRLGGHVEEDFTKVDLVIRAASAPLDSPYLTAARNAGVAIETDETLFLALAPPVTLVGVTGTRGKTTTTQLLYEIVHAHKPDNTFLAGNVRGAAAVPLLDAVHVGDTIVMELSSWQLQQFGEKKISPKIAVFTTFYPDHLNYYHGSIDAYLGDKAHSFLNQAPGDTLVVSTQVLPMLQEKYWPLVRAQALVADPAKFPSGWSLKIPGAHNVLNAMCAIEAARALNVPEESIKTAVENFKGVPGRLELIREVHGVTYYNDTTSTSPDATLAALQALKKEGASKVILIFGGADKTLDMSALAKVIPQLTKHAVLLAGTGADVLLADFPSLADIQVCDRLQDAFHDAVQHASSGDSIVLSPGFASFGMFKNEYDRGDQFTALVNGLA
ncbi:MAG: UDP-N-acetylmuramoyl-L-alanine--D-glutamate ligase [Patescibacteria group bacterium]